MARNYSSTAVATTLTSGINNSVGSITVGATTGFPSSYPYTLIIDPDLATEEVVTVTAGGGLTLTVTRGQDGTSGQAHSAGAVVKHGVSARDFSEPQQHIDNTTNPHGLTIANLVTLTGTQTLTNKTLTAPTISGSVGGTATMTGATLVTPSINAASFTGTSTNGTFSGPTIASGIIDGASTIGTITVNQLMADRSAWTDWTPTFTNITSGAGTFRYKQIGKTVFIRGRFSGSGTVTSTNTYSLSLPAQASSSGTQVVFGWRTGSFQWWTIDASGTTMYAAGSAGDPLVGSNPSFFQGVYEAL